MILKIVSPINKYKDVDTYKDVLDYVLNPRKAKYRLHFNVSPHHPAKDMRDTAECFRKSKGTKIRHMIISFHPRKEAYISPQDALTIAGSICEYYADEYQLVAAVHRDSGCVHAHIIMNTVNIVTGKKYSGKKKEWYALHRYIKDAISQYGLHLRIDYETSQF